MNTLSLKCTYWIVLVALGSAAAMASSNDVEAGAQAEDSKTKVANEPHEKNGNSY